MAKGIFTYGETWTANYSFSDGLITEETEGRVGVDKMGVSRCPISNLTVWYISLLSRIQTHKIRDT
jgi:hypothetical protein